VNADFTGEVSLRVLAEHPFELEECEEQLDFLKVLKVMMYKIGLLQKRQDVIQKELQAQIS